jgi:hypothetical protein
MSAAPLSGPQPPRRIDLGGVAVDLLQIGTFRSDAGAIFGPVPRTTWEPLVHAEIDAASRLLQSLNLLPVQTSSANLLLDEFAFHENPDAIWRSIYPSISNRPSSSTTTCIKINVCTCSSTYKVVHS